MGIKLMDEVLWRSRSKFGPRLVLLAIASEAGDDTRTTALTVTRLGHLTGLSRRATIASVRQLERIGELRIESQPGRYDPNRQIITMLPNDLLPDSGTDDEARRSRRRAVRSRTRVIWDRDGWEC
jgi:hypothetical protein